MATPMTTTPSCATEPPDDGGPSAISLLFGRFLGLLALYIRAERDLEASPSFDPAVSAWPREAEDRRGEVTAMVASIWTTAVVRASDRPLQRMAKLAGMMIDAGTTEAFLTAYALLDRHSDLFASAGSDAHAALARRMLDSARDRLDDLATLSEHVDPAELATILAEDAAERVARVGSEPSVASPDPRM